MNDLNPCPFCGNKVIIKKSVMPMYVVQCYKCGAIVSFFGGESKEECTKRYNDRKGRTFKEV